MLSLEDTSHPPLIPPLAALPPPERLYKKGPGHAYPQGAAGRIHGGAAPPSCHRGAYRGGATSSRSVHLATQRLLPFGPPDPLAILQVQPNPDTVDVKRAVPQWPSSHRCVLRTAAA